VVNKECNQKLGLAQQNIISFIFKKFHLQLQGGSNMTGTDLCVNKPHCAAAVRP